VDRIKYFFLFKLAPQFVCLNGYANLMKISLEKIRLAIDNSFGQTITVNEDSRRRAIVIERETEKRLKSVKKEKILNMLFSYLDINLLRICPRTGQKVLPRWIINTNTIYLHLIQYWQENRPEEEKLIFSKSYFEKLFRTNIKDKYKLEGRHSCSQCLYFSTQIRIHKLNNEDRCAIFFREWDAHLKQSGAETTFSDQLKQNAISLNNSGVLIYATDYAEHRWIPQLVPTTLRSQTLCEGNINVQISGFVIHNTVPSSKYYFAHLGLWPETANTILTCHLQLWSLLTTRYKKIIIMADNHSTNKLHTIMACFDDLVRFKKKFEEIIEHYRVPGHTKNEVDAAHSTIQKNFDHGPNQIFTLQDYIEKILRKTYRHSYSITIWDWTEFYKGYYETNQEIFNAHLRKYTPSGIFWKKNSNDTEWCGPIKLLECPPNGNPKEGNVKSLSLDKRNNLQKVLDTYTFSSENKVYFQKLISEEYDYFKVDSNVPSIWSENLRSLNFQSNISTFPFSSDINSTSNLNSDPSPNLEVNIQTQSTSSLINKQRPNLEVNIQTQSTSSLINKQIQYTYLSDHECEEYLSKYGESESESEAQSLPLSLKMNLRTKEKPDTGSQDSIYEYNQNRLNKFINSQLSTQEFQSQPEQSQLVTKKKNLIIFKHNNILCLGEFISNSPPDNNEIYQYDQMNEQWFLPSKVSKLIIRDEFIFHKNINLKNDFTFTKNSSKIWKNLKEKYATNCVVEVDDFNSEEIQNRVSKTRKKQKRQQFQC